VTWVQQAATFPATLTVAANTWLSFDANNAPDAQVLAAEATPLRSRPIGELTFSNQPYEVNMAVMNRDDYVVVPEQDRSRRKGRGRCSTGTTSRSPRACGCGRRPGRTPTSS
jgi:hypothetical protein